MEQIVSNRNSESERILGNQTNILSEVTLNTKYNKKYKLRKQITQIKIQITYFRLPWCLTVGVNSVLRW
jgi:hypothetical protein